MEQSCSIKKYIPKHSYLVNKVNIKGEPNGMNDALYNLSKQKPNARLLFVYRWNMWRYLIFSSTVDAIFKRGERIKKLNAELKQLKLDYTQNEPNLTDKQKRKAQKHIASLQRKLENETTKAEEVAAAVDAPVLMDSEMLRVSARQMTDYLWDKGYFQAKVTFNVFVHGSRANIYFQCNPGNQFFITKYEIKAEDSAITNLIYRDTSVALISKGSPFTKDLLLREENRVYNLLSNRGYYKFKQQYFNFASDTMNVAGDSMPLKMIIYNPVDGDKHKIYRVKDVIIEPEYALGDTSIKAKTLYNGYVFVSSDLQVRPKVICDFIYIKPNSIFREDVKRSTLARLAQLGSFKFVDIRYIENKEIVGDTGELNCYIRMTPAEKYKTVNSFELNRTEEGDRAITNNYSTLYGFAVSSSLLNRNLAHSALQFETQLRAAVEVPFDTLHFLKPVPSLLNYQLGLNNSLIFPKLLYYPHFWPFNQINKDGSLPAVTSFNLNLLFEHNGFYNRTTGSTNLTWQVTKNNQRYFITPVEISLINAHASPLLKLPDDPLILNLFDQHIITDFRFAYLYNLQPITNVVKPFTVFRLGAEIGGFIPSAIDYLFDKQSSNNGDVTRKILGIKYFTYSKIDLDLRGYMPVIKSDNLAARIAIGLGVPFAPSTILPFEKRYYVGGANSIRAWRPRDLGPGSFQSPTGVIYDKSGDFKFEGSFEYRFPIFSFIKGAIFTDYGNVWLDREDPLRPGANFAIDRFYKEIAIGSGAGLRFDFSFFVFRFDVAVPMRDPALNEKDRWVYTKYYSMPNLADKMNLNIGIGYPF